MIKVGLTGGAASGKTTVCACFRKMGVPVSIADELARDAVAPGSKGFSEVVDHFGPGVVAADGGLDRAALRQRLVSNSEERSVLESIVQPRVIQLMADFLGDAMYNGEPVAVCEVPLLFELDLAHMFDVTVHVGVDRSTQLARLTARDGVTQASAEALLSLQFSDEKKRGLAHYVIENSGTLDQLENRFHEVFEKIVKK